METVEFTIFRPSKKPKALSPNSAMAIAWPITLCLIWIFEDDFKQNGVFRSIGTLVFYSLLALSLYFIISSFFRYQTLNGVLIGEIEFRNAEIIINDKIYSLKNINNLDFKFSDYYGDDGNRIYSNFNPRLSQGVNNYVTFIDSDTQVQLIYFKLETKNQYQSLSPFINEAIKLKKMEFKRGIDLVGVENVSINP